MSWPVRNVIRPQVRAPSAPERTTSRAARIGARKRVFSCTIIRSPAARQKATMPRQLSQVGARGFWTTSGNWREATNSTSCRCEVMVVAISTKSSRSR